MPAKSEVQQQAAGAALAAKEGKKSPGGLYGSSKGMYNSMSAEQLRHFAKTKTKGLPHSKACGLIKMGEQAEQIVTTLIDEDDEFEETSEVHSARTILDALGRLQASIPSPSEAQQHDFTIIRSSANNLLRIHGA